ncbi:flagellar filament capping protein FliD [Pseudomonas sp. GOM6]|uniref:flagellar filament capping protein FliD n=1 Tax=Pseudomonas sp. GOM6 TaxID=3036944 RepID=UPI002409E500|nr:flagellar filament capping protein FliD [Pseudomonas sp. GOM6]MDG1580345.1 flagellar filament capping protein FliD [Pseudomonas sp. GOM6]
MAGISGIGSGIDIDSIVGALVNAQKAPKEAQLARLEKATTSRFSALGQLKGALSELQSSLKSLNDASLFQKRSATSADTTRLTATATKDAAAGTYQVQVKSLASSSKVASAEIAGASSATFNAGQLTISVGGEALEAVDITQDAKLEDVAAAINTKLGSKGVGATVVSDPDTGTARLVLSSNKTGDGQAVTLQASAPSAAGATFELESLNVAAGVGSLSAAGAGAGFITEASNAEVEIDGIALRPTSNSVSDAISGVTLNLLKAELGVTTKVTVAEDKSSVTAGLKKFVESYNKLISTSNELTAVVQVGEGKAPVTGGLVGDSSVRSVLSGLRSELVEYADQDGIRVLADLGITTQKDGTLKIDDAKLSTALSDNYDSVASFLTGESGLMARLDSKVEGFVKSGGILEQRMNGLQGTLKSVDEQREDLTRRVEQLQTRLYAQYNAMDSLVSQLNQTSERLTQSLASLPGFVKKDK